MQITKSVSKRSREDDHTNAMETTGKSLPRDQTQMVLWENYLNFEENDYSIATQNVVGHIIFLKALLFIL